MNEAIETLKQKIPAAALKPVFHKAAEFIATHDVNGHEITPPKGDPDQRRVIAFHVFARMGYQLDETFLPPSFTEKFTGDTGNAHELAAHFGIKPSNISKQCALGKHTPMASRLMRELAHDEVTRDHLAELAMAKLEDRRPK